MKYQLFSVKNKKKCINFFICVNILPTDCQLCVIQNTQIGICFHIFVALKLYIIKIYSSILELT